MTSETKEPQQEVGGNPLVSEIRSQYAADGLFVEMDDFNKVVAALEAAEQKVVGGLERYLEAADVWRDYVDSMKSENLSLKQQLKETNIALGNAMINGNDARAALEQAEKDRDAARRAILMVESNLKHISEIYGEQCSLLCSFARKRNLPPIEGQCREAIFHYTSLLEIAIRKHRDEKGDDRCYLDDYELYAVLNEPIPESACQLNEPSEMIECCNRFVEARHDPSKAYLSPQREIEAIASRLQTAEGVAREMAGALIDGLTQESNGWCQPYTRDTQDAAEYLVSIGLLEKHPAESWYRWLEQKEEGNDGKGAAQRSMYLGMDSKEAKESHAYIITEQDLLSEVIKVCQCQPCKNAREIKHQSFAMGCECLDCRKDRESKC